VLASRAARERRYRFWPIATALTLACLTVAPSHAGAAVGDPDRSFGTAGVVRGEAPAGERRSHLVAVLPQSDGRVILGLRYFGGSAEEHWEVWRLLSDGRLDPSFGNGGKAIFPASTFPGPRMVLQPDGKLVAAGSLAGDKGISIARLNPDGSLDSTFGDGGRVRYQFTPPSDDPRVRDGVGAVEVQPDGKIVLGGGAYADPSTQNQDFVLLRMTSSGAPDPTFGGDGIVVTSFDSTATTSFGRNDVILDLVALPAGGLAVSGRIHHDPRPYDAEDTARAAVVRYTDTGDKDAAAGGAQVFDTRVAGAVANAPGGKVVLLQNGGQELVRMNTDGTFDPTFGSGGFVRGLTPGAWGGPAGSSGGPSGGLAVQPDGGILLGGGNTFFSLEGVRAAIARYEPDGTRAWMRTYDLSNGNNTFPAVDIASATVAGRPVAYLASSCVPRPPGEVPCVLRVKLDEGAEPEENRTATSGAVEGKVRVQKPGSRRFVALGDGDAIPVGSTVDATKGRVAIIVEIKGKQQTATLSGGRFQLLQKAGSGVVELALQGGSFKRCPSSRARLRQAARTVIRRLEADAVGRFKTTGRYASATVRGTQWVMEDRCAGTRIKVRSGSVQVNDLPLKRKRVLRSGQSYLARPRS